MKKYRLFPITREVSFNTQNESLRKDIKACILDDLRFWSKSLCADTSIYDDLIGMEVELEV